MTPISIPAKKTALHRVGDAFTILAVVLCFAPFLVVVFGL